MSPEQAQDFVEQSVNDLLNGRDKYLLEHDASERSITHKLAQYLQKRVEDSFGDGYLSVDCEYNRNAENGDNPQKFLKVVWDKRRNLLKGRDVSEYPDDALNEYATYPDIICHHRGDNKGNKIVIEVKKMGASVGDDYDRAKLESFTAPHLGYSYTLGAFVKLGVKDRAGEQAITWFKGGSQTSRMRFK